MFQVIPVREEVSVFFGLDPNASFASFIQQEQGRYARIVESAGIHE